MRVHTAASFRDLPRQLRETLGAALHSPFFNTDFLDLLETTGCVSAPAGWRPHHLWIELDAKPVFYMPVYEKSHSWGEFVFDQRWAQFYQEHGRRYYPKWVTCVPFTPSLGPRWWAAPGTDALRSLKAALSFIHDATLTGVCSSWHLLFAENLPTSALPLDLLARHDTQFHWLNHGYTTFDDFLDRLKSRKRKKIRRERERVAEQGITLQVREGHELGAHDWATFYRCYQSTYRIRGQHPYLTPAFFTALGAARPQQIMMVQALQSGEIIAAALCFHDDTTLYGRHWGALRDVDCLHFEACFYQGIDYCIRRGLQRFDPGTQGEHKLLRGFEPVQTTSWHWIAQAPFREAIAGYLEWEKTQSQRYFESAGTWLPYKTEESPAKESPAT